MNSFDQNQDSEGSFAETNPVDSNEMNSSSVAYDNPENDHNDSESRPFCFKQLQSRSENSSARNFSRNSNDNSKSRHSNQHLSNFNNLFRDNIQHPIENDYSSSDHSEQYSDKNPFVLKTFYDDVFQRFNSFVRTITDQEISPDSDFNRTIFAVQDKMSDFLSKVNVNFIKSLKFLKSKLIQRRTTC